MKHLVIPDTQVKPGVDTSHLEWIGKYIIDKQPEVVIQIGDFADMHSLSSYDRGKKSFEGRRYKDDISAVHRAMDKLLAPIKAHNVKQREKKKAPYAPRMILTLGNHEDRISRAVEDDPKLEGVISLEDLQYKERGWEVYPFLQPVEVDGVLYCHYFTSGVMGRSVTSARALVKAKHTSAVMGHVQTTDIYMGDIRPDGTPIIGLFSGTCYLHDEAYLGFQGNTSRRQIWMLHDVEDGAFDLMQVGLKYLKGRFGKKPRRKR